MYPRIAWELVADPFGSAKDTLGTTCLYDVSQPSLYVPENTPKFSYQGLIIYMVEIKAFYSENHMKPITTLCGKSAPF
jgi:hypothetical protein